MQVPFTTKTKDATETMEPHFHGKCSLALKIEDLEHTLKENNKKNMTSFLEYQRKGNNWTLSERRR